MVFQLSNQITLSLLKLILLEDMEEYITTFAHWGFLLLSAFYWVFYFLLNMSSVFEFPLFAIFCSTM